MKCISKHALFGQAIGASASDGDCHSGGGVWDAIARDAEHVEIGHHIWTGQSAEIRCDHRIEFDDRLPREIGRLARGSSAKIHIRNTSADLPQAE